MIIVSIDLRKIDQSKCKSHPNGAKYCELVLIDTPQSQYDKDYMVVQGVSKEDRAAGIKGAILGNGKIFEAQQRKPTSKPSAAPNTPESDDVPF